MTDIFLRLQEIESFFANGLAIISLTSDGSGRLSVNWYSQTSGYREYPYPSFPPGEVIQYLDGIINELRSGKDIGAGIGGPNHGKTS